MVAILVHFFQNNSCFSGLLGRHFVLLKKHTVQTCMLDNMSLVCTNILYLPFGLFTDNLVLTGLRPVFTNFFILLMKVAGSSLFSPRCPEYRNQ